VHRDAGDERKFVFHSFRLNSRTTFSKEFCATTVMVVGAP
jgi:hypothetical protein